MWQREEEHEITVWIRMWEREEEQEREMEENVRNGRKAWPRWEEENMKKGRRAWKSTEGRQLERSKEVYVRREEEHESYGRMNIREMGERKCERWEEEHERCWGRPNKIHSTGKTSYLITVAFIRLARITEGIVKKKVWIMNNKLMGLVHQLTNMQYQYRKSY